ncbi:g8379 [Coccomyxa viridis]|uniref:G8379 protein n=1 Tax=Coccomyxa viridis TaxID=1274662 RepID=A0ABP1G2U9_9CHLO
MVTVSGPDPKGTKAERVPFHSATRDGTTTVSVSGLVMPDGDGQSEGKCTVLCPAHAVRLFMNRASSTQGSNAQVIQSDLLPGTRIEVTMRGLASSAKLTATFTCPEASTMINAICTGSGGWRLGWQSNQAAHAPEMAILLCPLPGGAARMSIKHTPAQMADLAKGSSFTAMGSPFGALAPAHFVNHTAAGVISNILRPAGQDVPGLILADMHCLPGMEGGPILSPAGKLLGVLCQPLCSQSFQAEVPVIIPYAFLVSAFRARQDHPIQDSQSRRAAAMPTASTQEVLPDWSRRLAHTRSLPPPWQRPSVTPSLIRQQASAPLSQPAATSGSTGSQSLTQQHSHTTSLQQWEGQESKSPLVQQHVLLSQQHPARLMRFDTQRSAAQDSYIPASDDSSCGSIVSVSRNPGKHAERLKVIRNHLSASEEPDNRSLSPKELHSALPAQLQHCSAPAHDFKQQVYPALHSAGEGRHSSAGLEEAVAAAEGSVVALMAPNGSRASGIVFSAAHGYILTVAHLLSERSQPPAQQPRQRSQPLDDLSLSSSLHDVSLRPAGANAAGQGERVAVMGFPLLSPRLGLGSCVTAGIIAKVLKADTSASSHLPGSPEQECMFMTGASVHPGASGGAVIDEAGYLLGMVTSNTRHLATGRSLARLNYSLPAAALRPLWDLLRSSPSADLEAIRQLDVDSPSLRRVWALSAGLSPDSGSNGATERLQRLLRDKSIDVNGLA